MAITACKSITCSADALDRQILATTKKFLSASQYTFASDSRTTGLLFSSIRATSTCPICT
ncbi:hypothetical protein CW304_30170 [Bacillus sp. UFRGS-B20]|nr:hypothetical protein CW304_30170 [Bacillus sp. UFRGS-B20]